MKILMLAQFFPPVIGGEERHVMNLSAELVRRGHDVVVGTQQIPSTSAGRTERERLDSGVEVRRLRGTLASMPMLYAETDRPHHPPAPDPLLTRGIARLIRDIDPDVVHAHNWIVNSSAPLPRRRKERETPYAKVLTLHDYSHVCAIKRLMRDGVRCQGPALSRCPSCAGAHYGPLVGLATYAATSAMRPIKDRSMDHIVVVSRAVADGNGLAQRNIPHSVIPNFIPDGLLSTPEVGDEAEWEESLPPEGFLLFAGDLSRDKGVPTLLDAYANHLTGERPPLLLIGRRTAETPEQLPSGVTLVESWPHAKVMEAFRRCRAAVLPSIWPDPCPTTVLEAMAARRPVVTSATGGMVDMVEDGTTGYLIPPGDAAALGDRIQKLIDNPEAAIAFGRAGHEKARHFTASSVAEKMEALYDRLVPPATKPAHTGAASR